MSGSRDRDITATAELVASLAEAHEARVLQRRGGDLLVAVDLRLSDGRVVPHLLAIDASAPIPEVREQTPARLPAFCPNRHINGGGTFCMGWQTADPLSIADEATAAVWWARLLKYLRQQEMARKLRRWPAGEEWAHGDAAVHQWRAEACARALGPGFEQALRARRLNITTRRGGAGFRALRDGPRCLYSVWSKSERVATLGQRCFCGSGRTLRSCADHADRASELVAALMAWERAEAAFWEEARGRPCCGTLFSCPLRIAPLPANLNSEQNAFRAA